jgi:tight adherence protein C
MSLTLLLALIGVFASVGLATAAATSALLTRNAPERKRLRALSEGRADSVETLQLTEKPTAKLERFAKMVPKSPKEMSATQRRLTAAGYRGLGAAVIYSLSELGLPVLFGLCAAFFIGYSTPRGLLAVLFAAIAGFFLPSLWLSYETGKRQKAISNGLPDALDLLIVCIEAGSSIDQSIVKASDELSISHPILAEELSVLTAEIRAGKPRIEAFKNLASRTKVDDVRSLVAMLVQTDRFGTSVAQALRTHAETSRTKRRQRAEEKAAKLGVKLVFPLVFLLFPAFFVVTLGPAIIQYVRLFKGEIVQ